MKILILEDDPIEADRLVIKVREYFKQKCHIIGPVSSFKQAIEAVKHYAPNIALIDIGLGENQFGGINFAEALQAFHQIPVIFLTGITNPKVLQETSAINFSDLIAKPWQESALFMGLSKAKDLLDSPNILGHRTFLMPNKSDRLWLRINKGEYEGVNYSDIVLINSNGHYNEVVIYKQKPLFIIAKIKDDLYNRHLGYYDNFFLLGRGCIINRKYVKRVRGNEVVLDIDGKATSSQDIPRGWKSALLEWLGIGGNEPHA